MPEDDMKIRVAGLLKQLDASPPERLYLIDRDGKVEYKGGIGAMYFKPSEWEEAIVAYLDARA